MLFDGILHDSHGSTHHSRFYAGTTTEISGANSIRCIDLFAVSYLFLSRMDGDTFFDESLTTALRVMIHPDDVETCRLKLIAKLSFGQEEVSPLALHENRFPLWIEIAFATCEFHLLTDPLVSHIPSGNEDAARLQNTQDFAKTLGTRFVNYHLETVSVKYQIKEIGAEHSHVGKVAKVEARRDGLVCRFLLSPLDGLRHNVNAVRFKSLGCHPYCSVAGTATKFKELARS
jgi:hypothetical protein